MKRATTPSFRVPGEQPAAVRLLTLQDAATVTGRNPELLRRWCVAGRIRCQRVGRDWLVAPTDLAMIEGMPRRGVSRRTATGLDDLSVLPPTLRDAVLECLEPGETVRVVALGVEDSALIATDRKLLVARDGVLVTEPEAARVATWPLAWARRVQLTVETSAGAIVVTPGDPDDRAIVLLLARPQLPRAEAAADALRGLVQGASSGSG